MKTSTGSLASKTKHQDLKSTVADHIGMIILKMGCGQQCVHLHRDLGLSLLQALSFEFFSLSAHEGAGAGGQNCFEAAPAIKLPCSKWSLLDLWAVSGFMLTCPAWCQTCQLIAGCQRSLGMAPSSFSDGETKLNLLWKTYLQRCGHSFKTPRDRLSFRVYLAAANASILMQSWLFGASLGVESELARVLAVRRGGGAPVEWPRDVYTYTIAFFWLNPN